MKTKLALLAVLSFFLLACGTVQTVTLATPIPTPTSCATHSATLSLSASATTIRVGETLIVTAALNNTGCVAQHRPSGISAE